MSESTEPISVRQILPLDPALHGKGSTIAVIDVKVPYHPDLITDEFRYVEYVDTSDQGLDAEALQSPHLATDHSVGVASIAAGSGRLSQGRFTGVAPHADLVLVKPFPMTEQGRLDMGGRPDHPFYATALEWVVYHQKTYDIRIVNLSIGPDPDCGMGSLPWVLSPAKQRVEWAVSRDLCVVVPIGNASGSAPGHLFCAPSALTIGSVAVSRASGKRTYAWEPPCYGGELVGGKWTPDLLAPGKDLIGGQAPANWSADQDHPLRGYTRHTGASFAGPYVSGLIALMLEANPALSFAQIRSILHETAHPLPGLRRDQQGTGVIQPRAATDRAFQVQGERRDVQPTSFAEWQRMMFGTPEETLTRLRHTDGQTRYAGALAACFHGAMLETRLAILTEILTDPNPWIRSCILCMIGQCATTRWSPALVEPLLSDSSPHVRCAALWALSRHTAFEDLSLIVTALYDDHPDVRLRAAIMAEAVADPRLMPHIIERMPYEAAHGALQFNKLRWTSQKITGHEFTPSGNPMDIEDLIRWNQEIAAHWVDWWQRQ